MILEYHKIINLLDNTTNQPSKFRTKKWVEINDESRGTYNAINQTKFKTSMIRSNLCDHSDAYIHVKGTITVPNTATAANRNKNVIKYNKNCALFSNCISEIKNIQVDYAHYIGVA